MNFQERINHRIGRAKDLYLKAIKDGERVEFDGEEGDLFEIARSPKSVNRYNVFKNGMPIHQTWGVMSAIHYVAIRCHI